MKALKKPLSLLLVLCMVAGMLCTTTFAAEGDPMNSESGESQPPEPITVTVEVTQDDATLSVDGETIVVVPAGETGSTPDASEGPTAQPVSGDLEAQAPDQPLEDQEPAPTPSESVDLGEGGVTVEVKPGESGSETFIPGDVSVPDDAAKTEDGSYTWTEVIEEGGKTEETITDEELPSEEVLSGLTPETETEEIKDEEGNVIGTRTIETYTLEDGTTYKKTSEVYGTAPEDGEADEEQPEETTESTKTTTTEDTTEIHEVKPGTVTVEMSSGTKEQVEGENGEVEWVDSNRDGKVTATGATVVIKNDGDNEGKFAADITLKLSGKLVNDGVKITVTGPNGEQQEATLTEVTVDGKTSYTLTGINVGNLSGNGDEIITLTLTGEQIFNITQATAQAEAESKPPQTGIDTENKKWLADFLYSDGTNGLGDAGNFSVFAKTFKWTGHTNANVAVGEMDVSSPFIGVGGEKSPAGSDELNYSNRDLCYVGSFKGNGAFAMNNTNSYLILGSEEYTVQQNQDPGQKEQYTFTKKDEDGNVIQTVNKQQGNIKDVLVADDPIDFDYALGKLAEYAVNLQNQTDVNAQTTDEAKAAAQEVVNQIARATNISTEGNKDITIDCTACPQSVDGTYLVTISISDLQALEHDQFIYLDQMSGLTGDGKVLVNVTGLDDNTESYNIKANIRPNHEDNAWGAYNSKVMFNFGGYDGKLNFEKQWFGSVLAPNASLQTYDQFNGKIIANAVVDGGNEQHDNGGNWDPDGEVKPPLEPETVKMQMTVTLKVKVDAAESGSSTSGGNVSTEISSITKTYYTETVPEEPNETPNETPDPTPTPTPPTTDIPDEETPRTEPDPEPTPDVEIPDEEPPLADVPETPVEIPNEEPPLVDVPEEEPPLVEIPEEEPPLVDIPEEQPPVEIDEPDVPLADVPQTGDISLVWYAVFALSVCGLAVITLLKKREEHTI